MNCPHCASPSTKEQRKITALGYRTFRCAAVPTQLQRTHGDAVQLPGISHRYLARRALAVAVEAESA